MTLRGTNCRAARSRQGKRGDHGTIKFLVEGAGEDRVLFGSDMPEQDARYQVGRVVTADIPDEAKRRVLGLNAIEVLGLGPDGR